MYTGRVGVRFMSISESGNPTHPPDKTKNSVWKGVDEGSRGGVLEGRGDFLTTVGEGGRGRCTKDIGVEFKFWCQTYIAYTRGD